VRALRRQCGHVTLAAHAGAVRLLHACGEIDAAVPFDDASLAWAFTGEPAPEPTIAWLSTPVNGALVQAPSRPPDREHCARYLLRTLSSLGCEQAVDASPLRVQALPSPDILIHPGSGSPAKNWPAERFAASIAALNTPVRLIVGEADDAAAAAVEKSLGRPLPQLRADLPELAARLAGCRAYLGNDSGVSHVAGLCGARSVVLFGPTDPCVWRPLGAAVHVLPFEARPDEVVRALAD
jgi:hypothetical protein